jgi:poly-gamma-glutamate capsule biosynthesis protein CapA/YwtB (metallophosphatase superfamily)
MPCAAPPPRAGRRQTDAAGPRDTPAGTGGGDRTYRGGGRHAGGDILRSNAAHVLAATSLALLTMAGCAVGEPSDAEEPSRQATETPTSTPAAPTGEGGDQGGDTSSPPPRTPTPQPTPTPRGFTIAATGDILPHEAVLAQAATYGQQTGREYDFRPMFTEVAPYLRAADLAVCHLEVPLSADNADVFGGGDRRTASDQPLFHAPWQLADAIADAGFDTCSTAHNHSLDGGPSGVADTLDALERVGVAAAGTARTREEAAEPTLLDVGGVTVAHLSYTYGLNDVPIPADGEWMVDVTDHDAILARTRTARTAGAEFVLLSLHQGTENEVEPSPSQRTNADVLLAEGGVDLIVGHHAHVVQPLERFHGRVAAHGVGNLLSNMHAAVTGERSQDGVIALFEVVEDEDGTFVVGSVSYVPTWVDLSTHVVVDVGTALLGDEHVGLHTDLAASWERTVDAVTRRGADGWGVAPVHEVDAATG